MEFIQIAYCVTVPFFLLLSWSIRKNPFYRNLLAVSNILLIGYTVFVIRQLIGLYQLSKQFQIAHKPANELLDLRSFRLLLIIVLPFLSFIPKINKSYFFCITLTVLLYWNNPVFTWNTFDLFSKIPMYGSLLCSAYALLWLYKKLPYQSELV